MLNYKKMLLIYVFEECKESNAKTFDYFAQGKTPNRDFSQFTNNENNKFLRDYFRKNNLKIRDFKVFEEFNKNGKQVLEHKGVPVLVKRIRRRD